MNNEVYINRLSEITVNVADTVIESVRRKNVARTGLRIYNKGFIGVAGAIGSFDGEELAGKAEEALKLKIPYGCKLSSDRMEKLDLKNDMFKENSFVNEAEELLSALRSQIPGHSFSNKIKYEELDISLANNSGLNLIQSETFFSTELTFREKSSVNIYDGFIELSSRDYDRDEAAAFCSEICEANSNFIDAAGLNKLPVIFSTLDYTFFKKFYSELNGYAFGSGASLLSDKVGQKVFNSELSLIQTNNPEDGRYYFFDAEGTINQDYRYPLIKNGIVCTPYTDKKTALQFGLSLTGSAVCEYDGVPALGMPGIKLSESKKTIKQLLGGKAGIFIRLSMGGDFKPNGDFAAPVQLALLFDGEHFLGRLPQLSISSNLFDMFGGGYIGAGCNKLTSMSDEKCVAVEMKVEKI